MLPAYSFQDIAMGFIDFRDGFNNFIQRILGRLADFSGQLDALVTRQILAIKELPEGTIEIIGSLKLPYRINFPARFNLQSRIDIAPASQNQLVLTDYSHKSQQVDKLMAINSFQIRLS